MKTILRIGIVVVLLCLIAFPIQAQDKEKKETPYWYASYSKIEWAKVDSLVKFAEKYLTPIAEKAIKKGRILDYHLLLHHTGGEYNVTYMAKYPSFAAMENGWGWLTKTYYEMESDEKLQKEFQAERAYVMNGFIHYDEIYYELE